MSNRHPKVRGRSWRSWPKINFLPNLNNVENPFTGVVKGNSWPCRYTTGSPHRGLSRKWEDLARKLSTFPFASRHKPPSQPSWATAVNFLKWTGQLSVHLPWSPKNSKRVYMVFMRKMDSSQQRLPSSQHEGHRKSCPHHHETITREHCLLFFPSVSFSIPAFRVNSTVCAFMKPQIACQLSCPAPSPSPQRHPSD